MPEKPVCTQTARAYSGVDEFLSLFQPLTPRGKDWLDSFPVSASVHEIESRLDDTEVALAFLRRSHGDPARMDRIAWHLKRATRLPVFAAHVPGGTGKVEGHAKPGAGLGLTGLFPVKKFIVNYRAVTTLVDAETARHFGMEFHSEELLLALSEGGTDPETFFIADSQDPELAEARKDIRAADESLRALRAGIACAVKKEFGLDFSTSDYLIVPIGFSDMLPERRETFSVSPWDDSHWRVSLQFTQEELTLELRRAGLSSAEVECEDRVLARLSSAVLAQADLLSEYENALTRFDLARAGARLASDRGLVRPRFSGTGEVPLYSLAKGRYLPCERTCMNVGSEYTPLDLELKERAAVIFGSNMGGKTVALQSVLFFQILAQTGFFVPAISFATRVRPFIHYIGDLPAGPARKPAEGLSGFGFEIKNFCEAWKDSECGALLAFDEFARTTSSPEAEALISAALEALVKRPDMLCLFSTHFSGVERLPGVRYLRVPGLDREAASGALASDLPLAQRIRQINGLMRHGLVVDDGQAPDGSDAVAIASLLGLESAIVRRAGELYALRRDGSEAACPRERGDAGMKRKEGT
ncbi:MAG: hypothetical protein Q8O15_10650 [Rectinemataceae bacterium]|nr:hypothetical protein [Rectinemataceae bacterium]